MMSAALSGRTEAAVALAQTEEVPVFRPYLGPEVRSLAAAALDAGFLGLGSRTQDFEQQLRAALGLVDRHLVATSSCTEALHLAALLARLGPGDEVICPSFTYVAGPQAMTMTGASVVFCDIEPNTFGLDVDRVRDLISPRTRAIMVVHFAGLPARDLVAIHELAREHGLRVIEDAAHALGSEVGGRRVGALGDLTCFSFGPVKMITTLEGGAVVTPHEADVQVLHELRLIGINSDTEARYRNSRNWQYDVIRQGYRCHLGSVPAAIGLAQIPLLDEFISNRQTYCRRYDEAFEQLPGLRLLKTSWTGVAPFIYTLRCVHVRDRDLLMAHLKQQGIGAGIHFLGAHEFSYYAGAGKGPLSVTQEVSSSILTLPLHSYMSEDTLGRVIDSVSSYFAG